MAAGALLAAAADSLGGSPHRPALQNTALAMPAALNAASVSALLADRSERAAGSALTDPQTRPEPVERSRRGTKNPWAKSAWAKSTATKSTGTKSRSIASWSRHRSTKSKSRSRSRFPARHRGWSHSRWGHHSRTAWARHTKSSMLDYLTPAKSKQAAAAVHEALSLIGVPYRWGGTTRAGFDCSGFTQHVWAAAGVKIPRTVRAQARAGTHISLNKAEPGDLVVFYPTQHHVGLYVGKGMVIDSPHTGASVRFDPVRSMPVSAVVRVKAKS